MTCHPEDCCNCNASCLQPWQQALADALPTMPEQELPKSEPLGIYLLRTLVIWWPALVIAAFGALFVSCAHAGELDIARDAAWYAYHDKKVVSSDGVLDCDDHALKAMRYMNKRGTYPHVQICTRGGEGHVYLTIGQWAIDNSSPHLITFAAVNCDK